jgi:hemolysin activation/secretion protein
MGVSIKFIGQLAFQSPSPPALRQQKFLQTSTILSLINTIAVAIIYLLLIVPHAQANPKPPTRLTNPTPLAPASVPGTITISRFKIIGNQVIPQVELDKILQPYLFRPLTFIELLEVQQAITQLYIKRGYFTSGAFIPPQTISDRTIKIKIIPGRIESIKISGLNKLHPEYIRSRLAIATQPPLNQDKLLNALQLLQLDPLIKNISAELSQGINPGESLLTIKIKEADTFSLELQLDNQSTSSIGSVSRQISLKENNLMGFGDRFDIAYANTDGSDSLSNLSYVMPVGAYNGTVKLAYNLTNSRIITETFEELDLESKNRFYELTYSQPLNQTPTSEMILGFSFTRQNSQISLLDIGFPYLAEGTDSEGKTKISALRFFQEYSDRSQNHVFATRSQFSLGIDAFDATINDNGIPDSKFLIWRGQAQYLQKLTAKTNIFLRVDLQIADRPLLSSEQFSAGGVLSVRGYNQEEILGDNGFFSSVELHNTVWQIPEWDFSLELNPFFDFATVWNSDDSELETNTLASLGVGLKFLIGESLTANIDWGLPLIEDDLSADSLESNGVHFFLNFKPL